MAYLHVGEERAASISLYYEDQGVGAPVVLIHGFPLSGQSWEKQVPALLNAGFRVITYDRRGFGGSSQPADGYDCDACTHDLHTLMTTLNLHDAVLVGHAMGAGEVVRYLATYGSTRVKQVVLIAPTPPFLLKTTDNPDGVEGRVFDAAMRAISEDRPAYLSAFLAAAYNVDVLGGDRISDEAVQLSWNIAVSASAKATLESVAAWLTDFRPDVPQIDAPTLIIQGDQDRILPIHATGRRLATLIKGAQFEVIAGGPHGICWTHAEQVNQALLDFLGR